MAPQLLQLASHHASTTLHTLWKIELVMETDFVFISQSIIRDGNSVFCCLSFILAGAVSVLLLQLSAFILLIHSNCAPQPTWSSHANGLFSIYLCISFGLVTRTLHWRHRVVPWCCLAVSKVTVMWSGGAIGHCAAVV